MRKPSAREIRLLIYVLVLGGVVAWKVGRRWWIPDMNISTAHYVIQSTATPEETEKTGQALEFLYAAYSKFLDGMGLTFRSHDRLKVKLFKDREGVAKLLQNGSGVDAFEEHMGKIERIERQWYEHARMLKKKLQKQTTPSVELH